MDKLKSLIQKIKKSELSAIISKAIAVAIGIVMGCGSFMVFITTFGLSYTSPFSGGVSGGMINIWNSILAKLAEEKGLFYDQLQGASMESGLCLTLILLFLVVLSILIVFSRNRWYAIIYPVFSILPALIWGLYGSALSFAILTAGVLLFLISTGTDRKNYSGFIYVIAICLAAFVLLSVPGISKLADKPEGLQNFTDNTRASMEENRYGTNVLKDGCLTEKKRGKAKGTALKVNMSSLAPMYLRGYVGDILEDDGWEPLSNSVYYQSRNLMYWLNQSGFSGLGQLQQSADIAYSGGKKKVDNAYYQLTSNVKVQNVDANSRYAYVPYGLVDGKISGIKDDNLKIQNWGDSFITGRGRHKIENYSFTAATGLTAKWTEIASRYYSNRVNTPAHDVYDTAESHYNNYVYENYRYLDGEQRTLISQLVPDPGNQKRGHVEYNEAVNNVKSIVGSTLYYSNKLTGWKKNKSALENMISTSTGYDAHYATLATLIFRYYGIPARYVEGYLVSNNEVYSAGQGAINIPRKNNHAWCEIYVDGVGFVPVEVCPQYAGMMPEADYSIGITNKTKKVTEDRTNVQSENPNDIQALSSYSKEEKVPKIALIILGILAGLICLGGIVLAAIFLIKRIKATIKRRKLFKKGAPREAIRGIYSFMDKKGIKADEQAVEIGNRASYSNHMVTEEERDIMLKKLKPEKKKKDSSKNKKESSKKDKKPKKSKEQKSLKKKEKKGKEKNEKAKH